METYYSYPTLVDTCRNGEWHEDAAQITECVVPAMQASFRRLGLDGCLTLTELCNLKNRCEEAISLITNKKEEGK